MKFWKHDDKYLVVFSRGEKVVSGLTELAAKEKIHGASVSGLGALMDTELGFYHLKDKHYDRKIIAPESELISLTGNIVMKDALPFVHVHCALGDEQFRVHGGHLFEAVCAVTVEVSIFPFGFSPKRELDSNIGLALICGLI